MKKYIIKYINHFLSFLEEGDNTMAFSTEDRRKIFDNAGGKCERCGKQIVLDNHYEGQRGAWDAHHRTSVKSGGQDVPSNGKALCLDCHKTTNTYGR